MECPNCNYKIELLDPPDSLPQSFTLYCRCGSLLLYENGEFKDFHKTLHDKDPRWPSDGKNTRFIDVQEE